LLQYGKIGPGDARRACQCGIAGRGRRVDSTRRGTVEALRIVFEVSIDKQLVLDNGPARGCAQPVIVETWICLQALVLEELVDRIQVSIPQVFIDRTVDRICAALDDGVELAAGGVAEFR